MTFFHTSTLIPCTLHSWPRICTKMPWHFRLKIEQFSRYEKNLGNLRKNVFLRLYESATLFFGDIVGFTKLTAMSTASQTIKVPLWPIKLRKIKNRARCSVISSRANQSNNQSSHLVNRLQSQVFNQSRYLYSQLNTFGHSISWFMELMWSIKYKTN